jgi:hypothetical protein
MGEVLCGCISFHEVELNANSLTDVQYARWRVHNWLMMARAYVTKGVQNKLHQIPD